MKLYKYISIICIFAIISLLFSACSKEDYQLSEEGKTVSLTFRPTLDEELNTRAIGDATSINTLVVTVYEGGEALSRKFTNIISWQDATTDGVDLTLIEGHTYKILFWAQNDNNGAYEITDDGKITVNYADYKDGGFAKMEEMDAFYGVSDITINSTPTKNKTITLTRPLAQLNFADNTTQPTSTHSAEVTISNIPTSFNPFNDEVTTGDDVTFSFTDFPSEPLVIDGGDYYYLSCNYLFVPTSNVSATLTLKQNDTTVKELSIDNIKLENNKRTNVLGAIVQQPETWSVWDGEAKSQPAIDVQNRYIIDEAADIAWLSENGATLTSNSIFLQTKDIDMASKAITSIKLPTGSTYDGGGKTIKNFANSLFGDAMSLTVKDLAVENIVALGSTHIGTLVNTLQGSSSFANVSVLNSTVTTTNGAAGGMIGYIVRTTEKNRNETLDVSFTCCKLNDVSVSGSASEGKFVGLLSGYDNNEALSFDSECEAANVSVADYTSVYTKTNNSVWVTGDVTNKYDGWLGAENYRRAKVTFGGVRMVPRWDGKIVTAKTDLLLYNGENNKYEVHSPFDLAGVRNATASPAAIYLKENVDMHGQGADGKYNVPSYWKNSECNSDDDNYFMSFSTIAYLDGNNKGIYNLNINTQKVSNSLYYGGFIQNTSGETTHQNINFHDCCVVVPLVVYNNEDKGSAGMLVSNIAGDSYKMDNVHTYGCKIFALQKVGGLAARVAAKTSIISKCSVNNCYIENYEHKGNKEGFSRSMSIAGNTVTVSSEFYSYGEVGGMFGFVENNTSISNCNVTSSTIYAYGQDDADATIKGSGMVGALAVITIKGSGYYLVPGRHVSTFIGDIRTSDDDKDEINISNCTVTNTYCTNRFDKHNDTYPYIGQAYYVFMLDTEGSVIVDGNKLTLANCNKNTTR